MAKNIDRVMIELGDHGRARIEHKKLAAEEMLAIARLAKIAHKAGVKKTEIAAFARISRPALDALLKS